MHDPRDLGRSPPLSRRAFLGRGAAVGVLAGAGVLRPSWTGPHGLPHRATPGTLSGSGGPVELTIGQSAFQVAGRRTRAITINGTVPGPLLRFWEGDEAVIHVTNTLDEDTSVHWHGILVPNGMDGVPGVNFPGIRPGETFTYRFPVRQYGTYWYHSHSGMQEQLGHYAPLVIDPARGEPHAYEREHVILLSDWTFEDPHRILARLKKRPDYYNFRRRTLADFVRDVGDRGLAATLEDRLEWGRMRMNPTDVSDVTGSTYTYLMNGWDPTTLWTGLFQPNERVRLRFINGSAATTFDVRLPGLPLQVIQVSGQHVRPVETDEIRIGIAETYDVIVQPTAEAHTIFAEAMDRSGFARGTLAVEEGMEAPVPTRRARPLLTMADMGHGGDEHAMHAAAASVPAQAMDHAEHAPPPADPHAGHDMAAMPVAAEAPLRPPGTLPEPVPHGSDDHGPGNAAVPMVTSSRLHEPGLGLGGDGWRVLTYSDLEAPEPWEDFLPPDREIELHLTGNMERFMWSIDGVKFSQAEPIRVTLGERIRLVLVNDTMMHHPMHLHGFWMELENGKGRSIPRVHTVNVKPAERVSLLFTADAPGPWAFHCHVLYHMDAGMFRVFEVLEPGASPTTRPHGGGSHGGGHGGAA